jgi:hypothetical protein
VLAGSFQGRQPWPLRDVPDGRGRSVAVSRADISANPFPDRPGACTAQASMRRAGGQMRQGTTAEVRLDQAKATSSSAARPAIPSFRWPGHPSRAELVAALAQSSRELRLRSGTPGNVGQKPHNGARWRRNAENVKSRCRALTRYRHI